MIHSSKYWIGHFRANAQLQRVNWDIAPNLTSIERDSILNSLQAWQLGETSDGAHLIAAASRYATKIGDPDYVEAVHLFIKEEQKHGNNLGQYLDRIGERRVRADWGDTLFRQIRYFATSMELWTLAVVTVESTAQVFYRAMKDATNCTLLKQICTDILVDEAYHITFQTERLGIIFQNRSFLGQLWRRAFYKMFFYATIMLVWVGHRRLFKSGGLYFVAYLRRMRHKYQSNIRSITYETGWQLAPWK